MSNATRDHSASRPCHVLVADGDPNVRAALRLLLARDPALRVVGGYRDGPDLLRAVAAAEPDLILLDWELPGLHSGGRLAELRRLCPTTPIIALSTHDEQRPRALAAGVAAFVGKSEAPTQLLAALSAATALSRATTGAIPPVATP